VEPIRLLEALMDLTREAGIEVRPLRPSATREAEFGTSSGICRVRGSIWVVLAASDPVEAQIDVLASALRQHAAEFLENRYLPPALRERLNP